MSYFFNKRLMFSKSIKYFFTRSLLKRCIETYIMKLYIESVVNLENFAPLTALIIKKCISALELDFFFVNFYQYLEQNNALFIKIFIHSTYRFHICCLFNDKKR